ncbi:cysteine proteinase [Microthyrium microscopicum]|uniref:Cysteine proteinase n=1 Tax=Microthyrium microscopicum TaxID=703497 RepID=A0A6A6UIK3_9PEZI|nr:cysteine proteinase [Microthyrium microscopicum]
MATNNPPPITPPNPGDYRVRYSQAENSPGQPGTFWTQLVPQTDVAYNRIRRDLPNNWAALGAPSPIGLRNNRVWCYLNASLQPWLLVNPRVAHFINSHDVESCAVYRRGKELLLDVAHFNDKPKIKPKDMSECPICILKNLLDFARDPTRASSADYPAWSLQRRLLVWWLAGAFQFWGWTSHYVPQQCDTEEFLTALHNEIEELLTDTDTRAVTNCNRSNFEALFRHHYQDHHKCKSCGQTKVEHGQTFLFHTFVRKARDGDFSRFTPFHSYLYRNLCVPHNLNPGYGCSGSLGGSLDSCAQKAGLVDRAVEDQNADEGRVLIHTPDLVVFQVALFQTRQLEDNTFGSHKELCNPVPPLWLHLDEYIPRDLRESRAYDAGQWRYKFAGVLYHMGGSVERGHYVSNFHVPAKNGQPSRMVYFNDLETPVVQSQATPTSHILRGSPSGTKTYKNINPYLFYYVRAPLESLPFEKAKEKKEKKTEAKKQKEAKKQARIEKEAQKRAQLEKEANKSSRANDQFPTRTDSAFGLNDPEASHSQINAQGKRIRERPHTPEEDEEWDSLIARYSLDYHLATRNELGADVPFNRKAFQEWYNQKQLAGELPRRSHRSPKRPRTANSS